jgi:hypothetical protein
MNHEKRAGLDDATNEELIRDSAATSLDFFL